MKSNENKPLIIIGKRGTGSTYDHIIQTINVIMYEDLNPNCTDIPGALSHLQLIKELMKKL